MKCITHFIAMDFYTFSLLLGAIGLGAMALSGIGQRGHLRSHAARGSRSGASARGHAPTSGSRGGRTAARGAARGAMRGHARSLHDAVWSLMSPRTMFSILLGTGMTGSLMRPTFGGIGLLIAALAGGLLFDRLLVTPIWNFVLRFASHPALTLESCIADEATAVTSFNAEGHGLVAVELDGQVVQILGTLQDADRAAGIRVRAGGRVRIEDIDPARNRCRVSAL